MLGMKRFPKLELRPGIGMEGRFDGSNGLSRRKPSTEAMEVTPLMVRSLCSPACEAATLRWPY